MSQRRRRTELLLRGLALVMLMWLQPALAFAQLDKGLPDFGMRGSGTQSDERPEVVVSAIAQRSSVRPGDQIAIAIVLDHAEHWHSWPSADQDVLPKEIAEFAIRTEISVSEVPGWVSMVGPVQWPTPSLAKVADPMGGGAIEVPTYQGRAIAYLPLIVSEAAANGEQLVVITVSYQACDESQCLMPQDVELPVSVRVDPNAAASSDAATDKTFAGFDPSVYALMASTERAPRGDVGAPSSDGGTEGANGWVDLQFYGLSIPSPKTLPGLLLLMLASALGGFILNLTPCVLPVIPIKVMTITKHAQHPGRSLYLGTWMALGVIAFWVGIGLPVAFVNSFGDPSRIFGIWWVTFGIGVVIGVMGLGIMGLFQIKLPQAVYAVNPDADTARGSFLFGVMTAVLGLPCFGFIAAGVLAAAVALGPVTVLAVFLAIGIGMAAPYLVLSAKPSWIEKMPRTGPASELVKQVMGLLLLAAAAYFVGSGLIALVAEQPYLAKLLHWWAVAAFAVLAGLWLLIRTFQITKRAAPRAVFTIVSIALGGIAFRYALSTTMMAKAAHDQLAHASVEATDPDELVPGTWMDYTVARFEKARKDGFIVVLDFTAEWCLNCKALKASVLYREPAKQELSSKDVVSLTVDLTSRKAPGWKLLDELGQKGIPLLAVFTPGSDEPWKSSGYTGDQVVAAIRKARETATTALQERTPAGNLAAGDAANGD